MHSFYTEVITKDARLHSLKRVADMSLLEPVPGENVEVILADADALGLELMVFETLPEPGPPGTTV